MIAPTFVAWKWDGPRGFHSVHANVLQAAVRRHYPKPHRFVVITDDPVGLSPDIEVLPLPSTGFENLLNPSSKAPRILTLRRRRREIRGKELPSCFRRLWNFSREAATLLGPKIVSIDLDCIVVENIEALVDLDASFVGWCDPRFTWNKIAGGFYMLRAGSHHDVYESFDAADSPKVANDLGFQGSDQAWMSYKMYPPPRRWDAADGVLKLKWLTPARCPPQHARVIFTSGDKPPWSADVQAKYPWIREHWRL